MPMPEHAKSFTASVVFGSLTFLQRSLIEDSETGQIITGAATALLLVKGLLDLYNEGRLNKVMRPFNSFFSQFRMPEETFDGNPATNLAKTN